MKGTLAVTLVVFVVAACGSESSSDAVAEVGWSFNYKDFTDDSAVDDLRGCDNRPQTGTATPAYAAITQVRVKITDPAGQVPGVDKVYDCSQGFGGERLPIRGIVLQAYTLTIEAMNAAGVVLYRYTKPKWDLTSFQSEAFMLPTATGEFHTYARYNSSLNCPAEVAKLRYTLYRRSSDGTYETTPATTGELNPACEESFSGRTSAELVVREVPVSIQAGTAQTYNAFRMVVAALNSSDAVVYCATDDNRTVRPGDNSLGGDLTMVAATSCE